MSSEEDQIHDFVSVMNKINDPEFLNAKLKARKPLTEMLDEDVNFADRWKSFPELEELVSAFSRALEYIIASGHTRNPQLGEIMKNKADEFADMMGECLDMIRADGYTSTRKIAERFNELGIKSARGGKWSHDTVSKLIRRRKELGLEGGTDGESLDAG